MLAVGRNQSLIHLNSSVIQIVDRDVVFLMPAEAAKPAHYVQTHVGERFVEEVVYDALSAIPAHEREKHLMLDIGAHEGYFGLLSLALGVHAVFVEPQPKCCKWLEQGIYFNGFQSRAEIVRAAIGRQRGILTVDGSAAASCNIQYHISAAAPPATVQNLAINVLPLRAVHGMMRNAIESRGREIALIHVDVEGAECAVLAGLQDLMRERRVAHLIVEMTPRWWRERSNVSVLECAQLVYRIARHGYRIQSFFMRDRHFAFSTRANGTFNPTLPDAAPIFEYLQRMSNRWISGAAKNAVSNLFQEDFHFERIALESFPVA